MVVAIILGNNVVASEIDGVSSRNLEEDTLMLADRDVKGLLEVLIPLAYGSQFSLP